MMFESILTMLSFIVENPACKTQITFCTISMPWFQHLLNICSHSFSNVETYIIKYSAFWVLTSHGLQQPFVTNTPTDTSGALPSATGDSTQLGRTTPLAGGNGNAVPVFQWAGSSLYHRTSEAGPPDIPNSPD